MEEKNRVAELSPPPIPAEWLRRIEGLESEIQKLKVVNKVCIVVFSGALDKVLAALNIATGSASLGCEVSLFFTFWGTPAMRKKSSSRKKPLADRLFAAMLPSGTNKLKLSTMHWGGLGTAFMKRRMKTKRAVGLDDLLKMAEELKVKIYVCEMSMDLMGMTMDDMRAYPCLAPCGVGTFMEMALHSRVTMFI